MLAMINFKPEEYFILYANCVPVQGASRSLICDLQKGRYYYIPNDLSNLLNENKRTKLSEIYALYGPENEQVLDEYLNYLIDNGMGFLDSEIGLFPDLNLTWDTPGIITNSIFDIDITRLKDINYKKAFKELSKLNCSCLQLRFFKQVDNKSLDLLLNFTLDSRLNEVRLLLPFSQKIHNYLSNELIKKHKRISEIIYFKSLENKIDNTLGVRTVFLDLPNLSEKDCGQICKGSFVTNMESFTEALTYNSCLNKKISLDTYGNIKHCPSHKLSYGSINNKSFLDAINLEKYQYLWKLKKDDIEICKDCEFRYICTDCRVFIEDINNELSKPTKCSYDPYSATWN